MSEQGDRRDDEEEIDLSDEDRAEIQRNWDAMTRGTVPWTYEDLLAMIQEASAFAIRRDDEGSDGSLYMYIIGWLTRRCKEQRLPDRAFMHHAMRYDMVTDFFRIYADRLRAEGLARDAEDDERIREYSESLLRVLAVEPYEGVVLEGADGDPRRFFHPDRVIAKAHALRATYPDDP